MKFIILVAHTSHYRISRILSILTYKLDVIEINFHFALTKLKISYYKISTKLNGGIGWIG